MAEKVKSTRNMVILMNYVYCTILIGDPNNDMHVMALDERKMTRTVTGK